MPHTPDLPCADCGELMWRSSTSLPEGQARCLPCRRANPPQKTPAVVAVRDCATCGTAFPIYWRNSPKRYCSRVCANRSTSALVRSPTDHRVTRRAREQAAPGLGQAARKALRDRWRAQGRRCIYCTNPATTIDHVLPLVRGGTNHEGNLAPCCKSCNSSKAGWTVIEWRTGKRLTPMDGSLPWTHTRSNGRTRRPPTGQQLVLNICDVCGQLTQTKTCTSRCHKDRMRNRYRLRVGIPLDAPLHSRVA